MTENNPFASEDAWEVSTDTILPAGDYVLDVLEAESGLSSGNYPQVELKLGNDQGTIRDWVVITQNSIGRVVQLTDALGLDRPGDGEFNAETLALSDAYIAKMVGRRVGVVVRSEPDYNDPTKTRDRVKGYVKPEAIGASDATSPGDALAFSTAATGADDDSIPF